MRTISLDLRQRILTAYDKGQDTREAVARRFEVSLGLVKKLLQQRRRTGNIAPRHRFSGRKPTILPAHHRQLRRLLADKPDLTLPELRQATGLRCTLPAIHYALKTLDLTYKKRHSGPANKTARTSPGRGGAGGGGRRAGTRRA